MIVRFALLSLILVMCSVTCWSGEISLRVAEPSQIARDNWPVTSGVPFAPGALHSTNQVTLHTEDGQPLPLQTEVLSSWPDGSIRWLLLDFAITLGPGESLPLKLRFNEPSDSPVLEDPLQVLDSPETITLLTGPLKIKLLKGSLRLFEYVWLDRNRDGVFSDDESISEGQTARLELRTPDGTIFRADSNVSDWRIEQSGPQRACLRMEGDHTGSSGKRFRYVVRLHAFRGQPFVKLHYTFINDNKPELMSRIKSLELVFPFHNRSGPVEVLLNGPRPLGTRLLQVDDRQFTINGQLVGKRAAGWAAMGDDTGGMAVGVRNFWQNWPKSLSVERGMKNRDSVELRVGICPRLPQGLYEGKSIQEESKLYFYLRDGVYTFKIGMARTHELHLIFLSNQPDRKKLNKFFQVTNQPLLAQCSPEHIYKTGAAGSLPPANPEKYLRYDAWMNAFLEFHLDDRDQHREYGMLNFGDWYWADREYWGNLEYDMARCFFTQYLRSGDRRYFDRAAQAARHYIDVDIAHVVNQKLLDYGGSNRMMPGSIWAHCVGHTGGYYGRFEGGKYFDIAPLKLKGAYQLGLSDLGHHWIGGEFDYYLLTGDRRALEVARLASDAVASICPTPYTDHIRDLGWPFNMMLDAYEATGDRKYLAAATRQWDRLKEHLDLEKGWQVMLAYGHCSMQSERQRCRGQNTYMLGLTLAAVARYHQVTQDPLVLQGLSAGVRQLIRESYSEEHRSFYLTSCIHTRHNPPPRLSATTFLSAYAIAYESMATGNRKHQQVLRESLKAGIVLGREEITARKASGQTGAQSLFFRFTPYALDMLERTTSSEKP